jgi:uncharacterized protein (DUF58 family)
MLKKRMAAVLAAVTVVGLLAVGSAQAAPKTPQSLSVTGFVVDQQCRGGDFVRVTLSATAQSSSQPVQYAWDFTNNGSFDTGVLTNPTVSRLYPDEVNVTARVGARNPEGNRAVDTVTFSTLRCEG